MTLNLSAREISGIFRVRYGHHVGTAFICHSKKGAVFVTAAHVLKGFQSGDNVLLQRDADWISLTTTDFVVDPDGYDLCIFSASNIFISELLAPYESFGVALGIDVKFLGFPHGLKNTYPGTGFPTPLVRNAFFSGVIKLNGQDIVVLDGFNNPGYSGGPVFANDKDGKPTLFGVISGYRYELETHGAIYQKDANGAETILSDVYVKPNSGMIYVVSVARINKVLELAKSFLLVGKAD